MSSMHYVLRLKSTDRNNRVSVCEANNKEEATNFFIQRKQTTEDTFHKLYYVEMDSDKKRK